MSDKKIVSLDRAVSYKGVDYAPGINEMPGEAAELAVKKKYGAYTDGSAAVADLPEDFKALPFAEAMERFGDGDDAPEVFASLKFYQPKIKAAKDAGMSVTEYLEAEKNAGEKANQPKGLPEDFPMRHVFAKLGDDYDSVEKIQGMSREDLMKINGIVEGSADKILAYGKQGK